MSRLKDLVGQRFNALVVIKRTASRDGWRHTYWECKCDCGNDHVASSNALKRGYSKSCGCLRLKTRTLPGDLGSFNTTYIQYKCNAKTRSHSFNLSKEDFREITSKSCAYCGSVPKPYYAKNRSVINVVPYLCNGVDRMNNKIGYEVGNCVPCCDLCNYMKRSMRVEDFLTHIRKIASYLG